MHFQARWHLHRKPIYVLDRIGRCYHLRPLQRVIGRSDNQTIVRYEGAVSKLYPEEQLVRFYWRKVGLFGRGTNRSDAPRFLIDGREVVESQLNRPFVKHWEKSLGAYS